MQVLEYDFNVISRVGTYMQFDLLTGDQYIRLGIMGYLNGVFSIFSKIEQ